MVVLSRQTIFDLGIWDLGSVTPRSEIGHVGGR